MKDVLTDDDAHFQQEMEEFETRAYEASKCCAHCPQRTTPIPPYLA